MNNYDYLTEHEKSIFGYIENIPGEYPPTNETTWNDEDVETLETLNDIFNL